jgi:hypothetical protein
MQLAINAQGILNKRISRSPSIERSLDKRLIVRYKRHAAVAHNEENLIPRRQTEVML